MNIEDKIDLIKFCCEWQERNNKKLSNKFIKTYCEVSMAHFYRLKPKKPKHSINFNTENLTFKEIVTLSCLPENVVKYLLKKFKLNYKKNYVTKSKVLSFINRGNHTNH